MNEKIILLVEDNPDEEVHTLEVLTQAKLIKQTMTVRDRKEALDYLFYKHAFADRSVGNPQIILLNVEFLDVLQKIRADESTKLIPVVILTSSRKEKDVAASYNGSANSYLVRPIGLTEFSKVVHQFLLYWVGLNKGLE